MPRGSRPTVREPIVTGDAALRYERLSGSVAQTKWYDISSGGVDGVPTTASILDEFHFDGGTDKVDTAFVGSPQLATNDWTCVLWYIRDSSDDGQITIAQNRRTAPSNGGMLLARDNAAGSYDNCTFQVYNAGGFANSIVTIPNGTDDRWHQLIVTWDADGGSGAATARVASYLDGAAQATDVVVPYVDGTNFIIGGGTYNRWTGFLDTFRVYNRVLSADEITRDYHAGINRHKPRLIEEGLVSQYVPQGQTTTAWADVTGSNNMTGAVTSPPAFDGDDYYTIGNPANLQLTTSFSVECWASQDADSSQGFERLVSKDDTTTNRCFILSQKDDDGHPFAGIFVGGALKSVTGPGDFADGNWHHYIVTHDGTTLTLYVDGASQGEVATGGGMDNDAVNWEIGRAQNGSDYLEGRCDTVRFYSTVLSLAQIKQNYYNGLETHA